MSDLLNGCCWNCGTKIKNKSLRNPHTDNDYFYCNTECHEKYDQMILDRLLESKQKHHSRYSDKEKPAFGKESLEEQTETNKKKKGKVAKLT